MNLTSIIFRILSWSSIVAAVALFLINRESFVLNRTALSNAENLRAKANLALQTDQNKSSDQINGMFRERGKLRLEIEETLANAEKLKEEAELILLKENDLTERNTKLLSDLEKVRAELTERINKNEKKRDEGAPLQVSLENAKEELKKIEDQNKEVKSLRDELSAELTALRVRRDVAQNSYLDEKLRLLNEIERPPHHYYGDELEINVMSVSPSGSGVFIAEGIGNGFRNDFKYFAHEQNNPQEHFYLKASLVQKDLTFLEFEPEFRDQASSTIRAEQKLFLIRTGDSNTTSD